MTMKVNSTIADFPVETSNLSNQSSPDWECGWSSLDISILTAFYITNILVLSPLSAIVLYLGFKRWRKQRSNSAATVHSDVFTYQMVVMEMIVVVGSVVFCVGLCADLADIMKYGYQLFTCMWFVKMNFHSLTCVERYLAVVHPLTYLHLKNSAGVRIRNISIGCVWLQCLLWACLAALTSETVISVVYLFFVAFTLTVVCFCSLLVLCALRHPGPGEVVGDRKQVDHMKLKAFHTMVTITGVLLFCFGGMLVCDALEASRLLDRDVGCAVMTSAVWFSLPGSLVLPLLFLHRGGTLSCCNRQTESESSEF